MRLLRIDSGFGASDIALECSHLRRVQGEPQSELALAQRILRFFQVGHVDNSAD